MFQSIRGNARGCLIFEPLFIIPFSLFITYASVYMLELGVSEAQIGLITSIGLLVQIFSAFISGYLTDRYGRRKALFIFDVISWPIAVLIWAISQNFWYFLIAAIFNGFQRVPQTAWTCLLVEDTKPSQRSIVFTVLQFIGVIGGLFAPLGGLLVSQFTLIPAVRIMYIIAAISMSIMIIARHFATHETEIGKRKKEENAQMKMVDQLRDYVKTVRSIYDNHSLFIIFIVYILFHFYMTLQNTFLSIYLVDYLGFSTTTIAFFPAISSVCMLLLMIFVIPKFKDKYNNSYMMLGFLITIVANILLIAIAPWNIYVVILCTIFSAAGLLLSNPYLETAVANAIADHERAKMLSILQVLVLIFISPAGIIGGLTYRIDPRIPFLLIIISLTVQWLLIYYVHRREKRSISKEEQASLS